MRNLKILVFLLVLVTFILLGYLFTPTANVILEKQKVNVTRVIDGDTLEANFSGKLEKIRLSGINCPEKKMLGYEQAFNELKKLENKEIELEIKEKDKYSRYLSYVYYKNLQVNLELVSQGLCHVYYYEPDSNTNTLEDAEQVARNKQLGIWKFSPNKDCVSLVKLQYQEQERCNNQEYIMLDNRCPELLVTLKDEATHIYNLELEKGTTIKNFSCVWNDAGDKLFLYDSQGLLLYYKY